MIQLFRNLLKIFSIAGLGASIDATTPNVYKEMSGLAECASIKSKLKYFMGHEHCNEVTSKDTG